MPDVTGRVMSVAVLGGCLLLLAALAADDRSGTATAPAPAAPPVTVAAVPAAAPAPPASSDAVQLALSAPGALPAPDPAAAAAVLPALSATAPAPSTAGLARVLAAPLADPRLGPSVTAEVLDVESGAVLAARQAGRPVGAASTVKLLTAAAALQSLGGGTVLPTRVLVSQAAAPATGPAAPAGPREVVRELVLVGGGDILLAAGGGDAQAVAGHAGLGDLTVATVGWLRAHGNPRVEIRVDDSLFSGPPVSPDWSSGSVQDGFVSPVQPVEIDEGVAARGGARSPDPALDAGNLFGEQLRAAGVAVVGPVIRGRVPAGAVAAAEVDSAPVAELVQEALTDSDNTEAEALGRLVAVATGRRADFGGAAAGVLAELGALQLPVAGVRLSGTSGLGTDTAVPADTLARLLATAAGPGAPQLRPLLAGLPVAGSSGTLTDRFGSPGQAGGLGVVRAKTGTLTGVSALAGAVVDADGRLLVFAVLADQVPPTGTTAARGALDDLAVALAGCGCR